MLFCQLDTGYHYAVIGYFVLFSSNKTKGAPRKFGQVLAITSLEQMKDHRTRVNRHAGKFLGGGCRVIQEKPIQFDLQTQLLYISLSTDHFVNSADRLRRNIL